MHKLLPLVLVLAVFGSCRKSDRANDTDTTLSEDSGNAFCALFEAFLAVHEAADTTAGIRTYTNGAVLTADTLGTPRTLIIDFGTGNTSPSGRNRQGKILLYQTGPYSTVSSSSEIHFDSFFINGYNYSGSFNLVTTTTGFRLINNFLTITSPDSSYMYQLDGDINLTAISGSSTSLANDDEFEVSGNLTMYGRNGNSGTATISTGNPILLRGACAEPVQGEITLQPANFAPRTLGFGTGTCDKQLTVLINTETINLNISF